MIDEMIFGEEKYLSTYRDVAVKTPGYKQVPECRLKQAQALGILSNLAENRCRKVILDTEANVTNRKLILRHD